MNNRNEKNHSRYQTFSENDETYASALTFMFIMSTPVITAFCIILAFVLANDADVTFSSEIETLLVAFVGLHLFVLLVFWRHLSVFKDRKQKQKIVEKTHILRTKKLGFFDADADSGVSLMLGSVFYFWIPDDRKKGGKRRFKVNMRAYNMLNELNPEDEIEVAYLPISGFILSFTIPGQISWTPYTRGRGKFK